MKSGTISASLIASHPFHSFNPRELTGDPEFIKDMLRQPGLPDGRRNNHKRLKWLLDNGIVTREQLKQYADELQEEIIAPTRRLSERVQQNLKDLLEGPE